MSLVILDGTQGNELVFQRLTALAEAAQLQVTRFPLATTRMAPCLGDFECWTKTPGRCRTHDGAQEIACAMRGADLVVFLAPISFGGYSADLKKAVDRLIGLVHPYFHDRDGMTRHMPRYERYAPILFVGLSDHLDAESADTFHELVAGNAINLIAPHFSTCIVSSEDPGWQVRLQDAFKVALRGTNPTRTALPDPDSLLQVCLPDSPIDSGPAPQSVVVLVGSARPKGTSTSELLARRLTAGLDTAGVATRIVFASSFIKDGRPAEQALREMMAADLLVVAAPLYVDGLPYLVVSALERLSERLMAEPHRLAKLAGILNCGYPEAIHNRMAMRMLRNFARQNRLDWTGGLALGGGEVLQVRLRAFARWVSRDAMRALDIAAGALSSGRCIPVEAIRRMARPMVSPFMFRVAARIRWWLMARTNGVSRRQLSARPWALDTQPATRPGE